MAKSRTQLAEDLFEAETHALQVWERCGAIPHTRRIFQTVLDTVREVVLCEEILAAVAKSCKDEAAYGVAWERGVHARTIMLAMESRLQRWF